MRAAQLSGIVCLLGWWSSCRCWSFVHVVLSWILFILSWFIHFIESLSSYSCSYSGWPSNTQSSVNCLIAVALPLSPWSLVCGFVFRFMFVCHTLFGSMVTHFSVALCRIWRGVQCTHRSSILAFHCTDGDHLSVFCCRSLNLTGPFTMSRTLCCRLFVTVVCLSITVVWVCHSWITSLHFFRLSVVLRLWRCLW